MHEHAIVDLAGRYIYLLQELNTLIAVVTLILSRPNRCCSSFSHFFFRDKLNLNHKFVILMHLINVENTVYKLVRSASDANSTMHCYREHYEVMAYN